MYKYSKEIEGRMERDRLNVKKLILQVNNFSTS